MDIGTATEPSVHIMSPQVPMLQQQYLNSCGNPELNQLEFPEACSYQTNSGDITEGRKLEGRERKVLIYL